MRDGIEGVTLEGARASYAAYLSDLPLAKHTSAIFDLVEERGNEPFGFGDALEATGADAGQTLATLSHLSQGRDAALSMSVVFIGADKSEHLVTGSIQGYLDGAPYTNPVTGETMLDGASHMHFRYEPVPGLLSGHEAMPKP